MTGMETEPMQQREDYEDRDHDYGWLGLLGLAGLAGLARSRRRVEPVDTRSPNRI